MKRIALLFLVLVFCVNVFAADPNPNYLPQDAIRATVNRNVEIRIYGPNDNYAIQDAIDSLPAVGGEIYIKNGTYTIYEPIILRSGIEVHGQDQEDTVLVRDDSFDPTVDPVGMFYCEDDINNVMINTMTIDGNMTSQYREENGIRVLGVYLDPPNYNDRLYLARLTVKGCSTGVNIKGTDNLILRDLQLEDNGGDPLWHNMYLRRCNYVLVEGCNSVLASTGNGFQATHTNDINVVDCYFSNNANRGLRIAGDSSNILVHENTVCCNGYNGGYSPAGIGVFTDSNSSPTKFSIINNIVNCNTNGSDGIKTTSGCSYGQIEDNDCDHNTQNYDVGGSNMICDYSTDGS